MFIETENEIKDGRTTDVYFSRTAEIIAAKNLDKKVKAEVSVKSLPRNYKWGVLCGVQEVLELLRGVRVNVRSLKEGSLFMENEPLMEIEGYYSSFAVYETAILGILSQESGVATKTARIRKIAGDKTVLSFGARRMHPAVSVAIERAAYIGGCDGVSTLAAAEVLGISPSGTIPHALVLLSGDTLRSVEYFDEIIEKSVPRIALIDTFSDEKFEAIRVAEAMGKRLYGIRLDTPSSRRGNLRKMLEEIRWELDLRKLNHVRLFVSGGLDEDSIAELVGVADGFGVGTSISSATTIDCSMDIVEIEGTPMAKKGKSSGSKSLFVCNRCRKRVVVPFSTSPKVCDCGGEMEDRLEYVIREGRLMRPVESVEEVRRRVSLEIRNVGI